MARIRARVDAGNLVSANKIGLAVGKVIEQHKMAKYFILHIEDGVFTYTRNEESIEQEARLDGFYVVRTHVPREEMAADVVVETYKELVTVKLCTPRSGVFESG